MKTFIFYSLIALAGCNRASINSTPAIEAPGPDSTPVETQTSVFPPNAVVAFNSSTCPSGWRPYTKGHGRLILGAGFGNNDIDGSPLASRTFDSIGGRQYTTAIPVSNLPNAEETTPTGNYFCATETLYSTTHDSQSDDFDESNMPPYITKLLCEKVDSLLSAPDAGALIISQELSSCEGAWEAEQSLAGRFLFGAGSGNLDADGIALSNRSLNVTGGLEYTPPSFLYSTTTRDSNIPGGNYLAANPWATFLPSSNSTMAGPKIDSNMPPFVVVQYCRNKTSGEAPLPSGTILAFNQNSCPEGWSGYTAGMGRGLLGSGFGNPDSLGAALTIRTIGSIGGRETTTGIPVNSMRGSLTSPPGGAVPAGAHTEIYCLGPADDFLQGRNSDGNVPPFVTLTFCKKD